MKKRKNNKKSAIRVIAMITTIFILACMLVMFTGCGNHAVFDTVWTFERAIIFLSDGEKIEGAVTGWKDFKPSDMVQVTIDGKTYLTHSANVILISE
jgi:hypothetical protein